MLISAFSEIDEYPERGTGQYAGFWLRVGAALIDGLIMLVPTLIINLIVGNNAAARIFTSLLLPWLYSTLMESSSNQGTLGKMAVGIKVTDADGDQISFGRATGRYFSKIISAIILYIGFIMVAFTGKKQGLHDIIAGTLVVRK